jgi:hypothetical protein
MSDEGWQRFAGPEGTYPAVEFRHLGDGGMRLRSAGGTLTFTASQAETFRRGVEAGEFDLPDAEE